MAVSEHFDRPRGLAEYAERHPPRSRPAALLVTVSAWGARFRNIAASVLRTLQIARMTSVLAKMSDVDLAQIGISRSEIRQYAERLILEDGADARDGRSNRSD